MERRGGNRKGRDRGEKHGEQRSMHCVELMMPLLYVMVTYCYI